MVMVVSDEDVMQTARELLERSATLQQELELFFQRQADQGLEPEVAMGQSSDEITGDEE